jgi:hypothetical protein
VQTSLSATWLVGLPIPPVPRILVWPKLTDALDRLDRAGLPAEMVDQEDSLQIGTWTGQDVAGADVSMNKTTCVQVSKDDQATFYQRNKKAGWVSDGSRCYVRKCSQGRALDPFGCQEPTVGLLADIEDRRHPWHILTGKRTPLVNMGFDY